MKKLTEKQLRSVIQKKLNEVDDFGKLAARAAKSDFGKLAGRAAKSGGSKVYTGGGEFAGGGASGSFDTVDNSDIDTAERDPEKPCIPDKEATKKAKTQLLVAAEELEGSPVVLSKGEARRIARIFYDALEGGWDFGMGTDDEGVAEAMTAWKAAGGTVLDMSRIACEYETFNPGGDNLLEALVDDYSSYPDWMRENVMLVIQDESVPFIKFKGGDELSLSRFEDWVKDSEANVNAIIKDPDVQKVVNDAGAFTAGEALTGAAAGTGVAFATGVATTLAVFMSNTGLAFGSLAGGSTAAAATGLLSNPVGWGLLAAGAVGGLGYAYFRDVNPEELASEYDVTPKTAAALTCGAYKQLSSSFKASAKAHRKAARELKDLCKKGVDDEELPATKCNYPELPFSTIFGRTREQVQRIQTVMNLYTKTRKLTIPEIDVDGTWSGIDPSWKLFIKHVVNNHAPLKKHAIASNVKSGTLWKWKEMSAQLKGDFPGYSQGPRGCLAFCYDVYNCDSAFGKTQMGKETLGGKSGGSGGGSGGGRKRKTKDEELPARKQTTRRDRYPGRLDYTHVNISATSKNDSSVNILEDIDGVKPGTSSRVAYDLIKSIKKKQLNFGGGDRTYNIKFRVKKRKKVQKFGSDKIDTLVSSKDTGPLFDSSKFEKAYRKIDRVLNSRIPKDKWSEMENVELQITFPMGYYTQDVRFDPNAPTSTINELKLIIKNIIKAGK